MIVDDDLQIALIEFRDVVEESEVFGDCGPVGVRDSGRVTGLGREKRLRGLVEREEAGDGPVVAACLRAQLLEFFPALERALDLTKKGPVLLLTAYQTPAAIRRISGFLGVIIGGAFTL